MAAERVLGMARACLGAEPFDALVRPASMTAEGFAQLQARAHVVTVKLDGVRAALLIANSAAVIAKAGEHRALPGDWPSALTVLDCEETPEALWWFDALVVAGRDVRELPLHDRLRSARELLGDTHALREKPYHTGGSSEAQSLLSTVGTPARGTDGLIFCDAFDGYTIPPLKFKTSITCDFLLESLSASSSEISERTGAIEYRLNVRAGGRLEEWRPNGRLRISRQARRRLGLEDAVSVEQCVVLECEQERGHWKPLRLRPDRRQPNSAYAVAANLRLCRSGANLGSWLAANQRRPADEQFLSACWVGFAAAHARALKASLCSRAVGRVVGTGLDLEELTRPDASGVALAYANAGDHFCSAEAFFAFQEQARSATLVVLVYWASDSPALQIAEPFGRRIAVAMPWGALSTFEVDSQSLSAALADFQEVPLTLPSTDNPHFPLPLALLARRYCARAFARD